MALRALPILSALALAACGSASTATTALGGGVAAARMAAANPVGVSPQPGTPDASTGTQISFLGGVGTRVSAVRAVGSHSGVHGGVLRAYSTRTGESFIPSQPFQAGESVTVTARVTGPAGGRAMTSFTIARQAPIPQTEFPLNAGEPSAVQRYSTAPALAPSTVRITTPAQPGASPGDLFLAPYQGSGTPGPMIVDQSGGLVWFKPLRAGYSATNFQVQRFAGRPVLSWWQGRILQLGFGQGEDILYDSSYRLLARVRGGNGYSADLHEIRLTPEGTAWIDAFNPVKLNLSSAHGQANGVLTDSIVQEIDVRTGLVMWEWHALGHIPLSESLNPVPHEYPWDYAHLNSADPGSNGDVLVSARNTWTVYDLDLRSGATRWRLGGPHSSFSGGAGTSFYWQHDAEFQPGGLISLFDNASDPPKETQSRGLLLAPDMATHTVQLVKQYANPSKTLLAESQGNALSLPAGNWLLGYGRLPNFTELGPAGQVLLDGTLGSQVQNFNTFLAPWSARPRSRPAVLAERSGSALVVSVSWNGATDVASWRVLAGSSPGTLAPVTTAARSGFQTTITASAAGPFLVVQALDARGAVIGASATVKS